jgi:hypothetical protein
MHPELIHLLLDVLGKTLAVGLAIMKDRDLRIPPAIRQIGAGDGPLPIIATGHPEDVRAALIGQPRIARGRGDHDDPSLLVHLRGRDCGPGARVAGDEHHAGSDELPGGGDGLFASAVVVRHEKLDLLAENTAGRVDVVNRHYGAALHLLPEPSVLTGKLSGDTDQDLRLCRPGSEHHKGCREPQSTSERPHRCPLMRVRSARQHALARENRQ